MKETIWAVNEVCQKCPHFRVESVDGNDPLPVCRFGGRTRIMMQSYQNFFYYNDENKPSNISILEEISIMHKKMHDWYEKNKQLIHIVLKECPNQLEHYISQPEGKHLQQVKKAWNQPLETYNNM